MLMHVLAPRRPDRAPLAGTFLSLTAHAAVVGAIVGGGGTSATPGESATGPRRIRGGPDRRVLRRSPTSSPAVAPWSSARQGATRRVDAW
jgi:hypothetical protein